MQAFTPFVQVTTYATRHFATLGLAHAAANHFFSLCTPVMRRGVCDVSPVIGVFRPASILVVPWSTSSFGCQLTTSSPRP